MKTIVFFNNKGGVGKTSMVYHTAWMLRELGMRVLAVDLDPQSNLTSAFLEDDELERLWPEGRHPRTMLGAVERLSEGLGDIELPEPWVVDPRIALLPGDIGLSGFEDRLSEAWSQCTDDNPANAAIGFRVLTAFGRIMRRVGTAISADVILVDVGPNIGSMNRAALVASDCVVVPIGADLFSLQGLRNLGPTLRQWRSGWENRRVRKTVPQGLDVPAGNMQPIGYVLLNPSTRENRPVKAYRKWADRIPGIYAHYVSETSVTASAPESDPSCIGMLKHFKSLMPMAQDARKPMFLLKPADGAIGGHAAAVQDCYSQFEHLASEILRRAEAPLAAPCQ